MRGLQIFSIRQPVVVRTFVMFVGVRLAVIFVELWRSSHAVWDRVIGVGVVMRIRVRAKSSFA